MKRSTILQKTESDIRHHLRLLFIVFTTFCVSGVLSAQQATYDFNDYHRKEWFVGFGFGPRIFFADHAKQLKLIDRISGGGDLYVGKWFGPYIGARVGGSWQILKGAAQNMQSSMNGPAPHAINTEKGYYSGITNNSGGVDKSQHHLYQQQFHTWHVFSDLMFDVSSIFEGENPERFWTLTPYLGLGYLRTGESAYQQFLGGKDFDAGRALSFSVGLLNSLRVGPSVDLNLDIRGAMFTDRFKVGTTRNGSSNIGAEFIKINDWNAGGRPLDGVLSVNVGVTFRFGGNGQPRPVYHPEYYPEIPMREPVVEIERVTEWKDVATDVLILFRINQSTLLRDAQVQLNFLARLMHEYPEGTYTITGYADEGTGNPDLNLRLSRARAENVKECLVREFGISPSRLRTVAAGGIENRYYNDPSLSRSVIIRPDKY